MSREYKYIFGPVMSRRLGRSLGVDLTPFKTCSLNCIYCECGPTTNLTLERQEFYPVQEIIDELKDFLSSKPELDIITFSGSGEPTLHSGIGEVINWIKQNTSYPVCVLTNGTLLYRDDVQNDLLHADIVIPSLDAAQKEIFLKINRPHPDLILDKIIKGISEFRLKFSGELALEIFLLPNINDQRDNIEKLIEAIKAISPDKVQLNSMDRPGAIPDLKPEPYESLTKISTEIQSHTNIPVNIISRIPQANTPQRTQPKISLNSRILSTLQRRPSDKHELSHALGVSQETIDKILTELESKGLLVKMTLNNRILFKRKHDI